MVLRTTTTSRSSYGMQCRKGEWKRCSYSGYIAYCLASSSLYSPHIFSVHRAPHILFQFSSLLSRIGNSKIPRLLEEQLLGTLFWANPINVMLCNSTKNLEADQIAFANVKTAFGNRTRLRNKVGYGNQAHSCGRSGRGGRTLRGEGGYMGGSRFWNLAMKRLRAGRRSVEGRSGGDRAWPPAASVGGCLNYSGYQVNETS